MVEVMPFGKYTGNSVEQIVFKDYEYFSYFLVDDLLRNKRIKKSSLKKRIEFVEYKVNNFKSVQPCGKFECQNIPKLISIYSSYNGEKTSSPHFVYCSEECFEDDPQVTDQREKVNLFSLKFRSALSNTKGDTNELADVIASCMGIKNSKLTKEYLEDFINKIPVLEQIKNEYSKLDLINYVHFNSKNLRYS
ncbi:MAG TPA: hypothetical protein VJA20_00795 [Candidatus Nanoarchaeia archaeon]|nr:hypothetical protein [Candidatus Nanoarchaeia archaeon]